jgi:hypothetical protein
MFVFETIFDLKFKFEKKSDLKFFTNLKVVRIFKNFRFENSSDF